MKLNVEAVLTWVGGSDAKTPAPAFTEVPFLLNICSNAASFLKHEAHLTDTRSSEFVNFTYEFRARRLDEAAAASAAERGIPRAANWVSINAVTGEPAVFIRRSGDEVEVSPDGQTATIREDIKKLLQELNAQLSGAIAAAASSEEKGPLAVRCLTNIRGAAGLGCVAHEIGSIPMRKMEDAVPACAHASAFSVDDQLCLDGTRNVFVSDLSVLPVSPPANPSLTLAALAIRLADRLRRSPGPEPCPPGPSTGDGPTASGAGSAGGSGATGSGASGAAGAPAAPSAAPAASSSTTHGTEAAASPISPWQLCMSPANRK